MTNLKLRKRRLAFWYRITSGPSWREFLDDCERQRRMHQAYRRRQ